MFRSIILVVCMAVAAHCNSAGAPKAICTNGLVPEHHVDPQSSSVPYSFSGEKSVRAGEKIVMTLGGDVGFLGFAVQAQNEKGEPVGKFKIVDSAISQTLTCSNADDTLTHKKITRTSPAKSVTFEWVAPEDHSNHKVKLVATVAKDGGTYWVRKVVKEISIQ